MVQVSGAGAPKVSHFLSSAEIGTLRSLGGLRRKGRLENLNPSMEGEMCEPFFWDLKAGRPGGMRAPHYTPLKGV